MILEDLRRGENGVRLGRKVSRPTVTRVRLPASVRAGEEASLEFEGQDPTRQQLAFVVSASRGRVLETGEAGRRRFIPPETGAAELHVYAVNEMNVVSTLHTESVKIGGRQ